MLVKELLVSEPLHLVLAEHPLSGEVGVGARDVVGALHHLERYVLLHALQQRITNYSSYLQSNVHLVTK